MTVGSLFAGIGGFDLGFQRAGLDISWQVEKDEWCQKVLARHFPRAKRIEDIRNAGKENLFPVDVICGGFPCQPFSSAGKQGGTEDDRYLWPEMLRVISELKPSWVVAENVLGLVTGKMEPVFEQVLLDLEGEGYDVQAFIIPACGVDAPHRRYRVWIIGNAYNNSKPIIPLNDETPGLSVVGNTNSKGLEAWERGARTCAALREPTRSGGNVADSERKQFQRRGISRVLHGKEREAESGEEKRERRWDTFGDSGADVPDSERSTGQQRRETGRMGWQGESIPWHRARPWEAEPPIRRTLDGVSAGLDRYRKDRLRGLGNAIIPDIAELFGHIIMEIEHQQTRIAA